MKHSKLATCTNLQNPTRESLKLWYDNWILIRQSLGIIINTRDYQFEKFYEMVTLNIWMKYVLAAAPGAGKTLMSIMYLDYRFSQNPNYRILVLTHATKELRDQYNASLQYYQADCLNNINLIVNLPHSVKTERVNLGHIDELIVDEGHQLYHTEDGMIQKLIKKHNFVRQIILTGSPDKFIYANKQSPNTYKISFIDLYTLWKLNVVQPVLVEIASTTYGFNSDTCWNSDGDLKSKIKIERNEIFTTLPMMMNKIMARQLSLLRTNPVAYKKYLSTGILHDSYFTKTNKDNIGKTMIVCRNIAEATNICEFLIEYGYDSSQMIKNTYGEDCKTGQNLMMDFKNNDDVKFLVVVYKGILGFDYPNLCNVIDLSCSKNVSRLFQLYCRLVRKSTIKMEKFYYKVVPHDKIELFTELMNGVLHMSHFYYLSKYDGTNFYDIPFIERKKIKDKGDSIDKPSGGGGTGRPHNPEPIVLSLDTIFDMNKLAHIGNSALDSRAYINMNEYMEILGIASRIDWGKKTDEELLTALTNIVYGTKI